MKRQPNPLAEVLYTVSECFLVIIIINIIIIIFIIIINAKKCFLLMVALNFSSHTNP